MNAAALWARLSAADLVEGSQPEPEPRGSPWFVRLMLGIAGWIGALFLLGFVGAALSSIIDDAVSAMIAGTLCCAGAFALFRSLEGHDAPEQFALAISLAGQGLLVIGLGQIFEAEGSALYFAIAAVELTLALIIANFLHRLLASGGSAIALALAIDQLELHGFAAPLLCAALALIWLEPSKWATDGRLWRPVGYGLVLAIVLIETFRLFGAEGLFRGTREPRWMALHGALIGRGLTGAVLVAATAFLSFREGYRPGSRIFLLSVGAALSIGILCMLAPGLGSALVILLLGFAAGNRLLVGVGILGLLGFAAHYYYSLHASLLSKSGILAVTGIALLIASLFLRRERTTLETPRHA